MRLKLFICLLLAGVTLTIYWPARHFHLVYFDDPLFVTDNDQINAGLTWHGVWWALSGVLVANWHPVTSFSFLLTHQFFGQNAGVEHLVNVMLHAANAALLFLALQKLSGATWRSAMVAAIFAWHPLRVESVAWIAERKDVLCGFFCLLTLLCYAGFVRKTEGGGRKTEGGGQRAEGGSQHGLRTTDHGPLTTDFQPPASDLRPLSSGSYWLALLFFALALMSKPMAVTLPLLMLLLDVWPLRRFTIHDLRLTIVPLVREKVPFFALTAVFCVLTYEIQKNFAAVVSLHQLSLGDRINNAVMSYIGYLGKFFWPTKLAVIYPYAKFTDETVVWLAAAALLAVSILCVRQISRRPYLFVGWFWFLIASAPIIGLVQVGGAAMADRYTYIPLIGPAMSVAWLVREWTQKSFALRSLAVTTTIFLLTFCAVLSRRQLDFWKNTVTLFQHTVAVTADNSAAQFSLGMGYEHEGLTNAAMAQYIIATKMNSADTQPQLALARLLREQGHPDQASVIYNALLQNNPGDASLRVDLAETLLRRGQTGEAIAQLEIALQNDPDSTEALNNLAWILAANSDGHIRDGARAVQLAERACELTHYKKTIFVGTLAAAYAEAGRFDDAISTAQKAIALAQQNNEPDLLNKNRELLELYQQHRAYHEKVADY